MAAGWVKSFQCKSRALEDVYVPNPKHLNNLISSSSCRKTAQNLRDVVETNKKKPRKSNPPSPKGSSKPNSRSSSFRSKSSKSEPGSTPLNRVRPTRTDDPFFPTLTELPEKHPSRNVVEIIFHTRWSPKSFSGRIEMLFKVQNLPKTVSRFEEYREHVKSKTNSKLLGDDDVDARCIADGNEQMRFHCLGPTSAGGIYDAGGMCTFSGKDAAICTFSGSGGAHDSAGGGKGRRAMLVCRVIAGRVCKRVGKESDSRVGFDSVSEDNGKLLVYDSRAVLPCFLIIYRL